MSRTGITYAEVAKHNKDGDIWCAACCFRELRRRCRRCSSANGRGPLERAALTLALNVER